jgi:hypothetical protein
MAQQLVPLPAEIAVVPRSQWDQRRRGPRYHCGPATLGQVVTCQPCQTYHGWVLDLSKRGGGLLLTQALAAETLFVLHLKSTDGKRCYELPCRVVHATTQLAGDWLIGCEFADALTEDDLDAML